MQRNIIDLQTLDAPCNPRPKTQDLRPKTHQPTAISYELQAIMKDITEISKQLKEKLPLLSSKYKIETLGLFGSYVRNEQQEDSDLDLLVSFSEPPGLLKFMELENYLSDILHTKVDLVMKEALKPNVGKRILKEVVML